jgi:acyl-CoA reductase-like NAD-dependent aldehyde dehydrogenase
MSPAGLEDLFQRQRQASRAMPAATFAERRASLLKLRQLIAGNTDAIAASPR